MGAIEVDLDISFATDLDKHAPSASQMQYWVNTALAKVGHNYPAQISIRVVEQQEMAALNKKFRKINKATNVLSFPYEALPGIDVPFLGDLVICAEVVESEAKQQSKTTQQHWAHLLVHGVLHLLGYDHVDEAEAIKMEALEIEIMSTLGFSNPYGEIYTS